MTTTKNLPLREKYSANGSYFRWATTILVVVLVMFFEFYLFSRYSVWQNNAGNDNGNIQTQNGNTPVVHAVIPNQPPDDSHGIHQPQSTPSGNEFHPVTPSSAPPVKKPVNEISIDSITIVDRESLKLIPEANFIMVSRGILELETNSEYFLSPERESALYDSCRLVSKVWEDSDARKTEIDKCKYLFFASLNQKQMKFVRNNMKSWGVEPDRYKAPGNKNQEKFQLEKCIELLSERVHK